jgi:hypothetical protein
MKSIKSKEKLHIRLDRSTCNRYMLGSEFLMAMYFNHRIYLNRYLLQRTERLFWEKINEIN